MQTTDSRDLEHKVYDDQRHPPILVRDTTETRRSTGQQLTSPPPSPKFELESVSRCALRPPRDYVLEPRTQVRSPARRHIVRRSRPLPDLLAAQQEKKSAENLKLDVVLLLFEEPAIARHHVSRRCVQQSLVAGTAFVPGASTSTRGRAPPGPGSLRLQSKRGSVSALPVWEGGPRGNIEI